jgi:hypothetical protein
MVKGDVVDPKDTRVHTCMSLSIAELNEFLHSCFALFRVDTVILKWIWCHPFNLN